MNGKIVKHNARSINATDIVQLKYKKMVCKEFYD